MDTAFMGLTSSRDVTVDCFASEGSSPYAIPPNPVSCVDR